MRYGLMIALVLAWVGTGWGAGSVWEIKGLKGLGGVRVQIDKLPSVATQDGLYEDQLKTDVELRLRKVGIRVLSEEERLKEPGKPYLSVTTLVAKNETGVYAVSVHAEILQYVLLDRDRLLGVTAGSTWSHGVVINVVANKMPTAVRSYLGDIVDVFINDFLTANPVQR